MPTSPELVMFGIQAALRINAQFRRAYADSTRSRAITLPLPNFPATPNLATALTFYQLSKEGKEFVDKNLRVGELIKKHDRGTQLSVEEKRQLRHLYREHKALVDARAGLLVTDDNSAGVTNEDINHLLSIRQWRPGEDPNPTMLHRLAGTFVNIGVDYFVGMPDVISIQSTRGKALRGILEAIDSIDFAEDGRAEILENLFVAAIETIRDHPDVFSEDEKARILVRNVAEGLYQDAKQRVDSTGGNLSEQERIRSWTQLVFRSVLSNAGETVFAQPDRFLGIDGPAEGELISRVGQSILDSILDEDKVHLDNLLTQESLDRIVKAALTAVGNHPELLGADNHGLKNIIGAIAEALAKSSTQIGKDLLPEAIRLILEETGENFELLMPQGVDYPAKNLLVVAAKEVLEQLAAPPPDDAKWKIRFGSAEALGVVETVLQEVVDNPSWLEEREGSTHTFLGEVTKAVVETLRAIPSPRLTKETGMAVLESAIRAVGRRLELLDEDPQNRRLISLALDAVFGSIFKPAVDTKAAWVLAGNATIERLVEIVLEKLALHGPTVAKIDKVRQEIEEAINLLSLGKRWSLDDFADRLETALA